SEGGGASHLAELLQATSPDLLRESNIRKIYIIGMDHVLDKISENDYLIKIEMGKGRSNFITRFLWRKKNLPKVIKQYNIDFLFNPGGSFVSKKFPYVTMCRNMLVF